MSDAKRIEWSMDENVTDTENTQPVEGSTPPENAGEEQLILGKFKDQAALEQAYQALESRLGSEGSPAEPQLEQPEEGLGLPKAAEEEPADPGQFDFTPYYEAFSQNGKFTDDEYAKLAEAGYPKDLVDGYITGMQATAAQQEAQVFERFEGQENYRQAAAWAAQNMPQDWQERFEADVTSGDPARVQFATEALRAGYLAANGQQPAQQLQGTTNTGGGAAPFQSTAEVEQAMRDPRYKQGDPVYHAEIESRLKVTPSNLFA